MFKVLWIQFLRKQTSIVLLLAVMLLNAYVHIKKKKREIGIKRDKSQKVFARMTSCKGNFKNVTILDM